MFVTILILNIMNLMIVHSICFNHLFQANLSSYRFSFAFATWTLQTTPICHISSATQFKILNVSMNQFESTITCHCKGCFFVVSYWMMKLIPMWDLFILSKLGFSFIDGFLNHRQTINFNSLLKTMSLNIITFF